MKMPSVRLTKEIREEITAAMLCHRFGRELSKIVKERAAFAQAVYDDLYKAADRKRISDLPEDWLPSSSTIKFRAGTDYMELPFNGHFYGPLNASLPEADRAAESGFKPFASKHARTCVAAYDANHKLAIRFAALQSKFKDVTDRHSAAESQIKVALNKASTTARLIELWPEAAPFCKAYEAAAPSLPSIPTGALNAMLDLPVSEAA
jgi:hypothetical protein